jgi:hypothetical protein
MNTSDLPTAPAATADDPDPEGRYTWRDGDLKVLDPATGRWRRMGDVPERWRTYGDDRKAAQPSVAYTDHAQNPSDACADCKFFLSPDACARVQSPISPKGWCKKFEEDVG